MLTAVYISVIAAGVTSAAYHGLALLSELRRALAVRSYLKLVKELDKRDAAIKPRSAHGMNQ